MELKISRHEREYPDDLAKVETEGMEVLCDDAVIEKDTGDLRCGLDHTSSIRVKIGDVDVAHDAMVAVRRAIKYDEEWEAEV